MSPQDLQSAILDLVNQPNYQPVKPRIIARRLGLPKEEATEVRRAVKRLVRQGRLIYASNHLVHAASTVSASASPITAPQGGKRSKRARPRVVGTFQRTHKGFGFVRPLPVNPEKGAQQSKETSGEIRDIFVPAKYTLDAATGDEVAVEVKRVRGASGLPGLHGRVVEVLERQTRQFVGSYFEEDGAAFVQVDGTLFAQPVFVGDPGAKNAQPDDKVVIEMIRFPSPVHDGEGVIIEVLGAQGKPGIDTLSIIREFNLPEAFAEDASKEARQEADRFDESLEGRIDLTDATVVTIDPADARDFDDAISLEKLDNGDWRLGVHIADVSHFVRPRSALDREAHNRGTSVYLPDRVIPMLPELISNGLASLQPGKVRYTKSVFLEYTPEGVRTHAEFQSAAIKSTRRLTYEQVDAFLADRVGWKKELGAKVHGLLCRMYELAMLLRRRRIRHGSLVLTMPEVKIDLDSEGRVAGAHVVEDTESHHVIEEFMLAANEAVAETLRDKGVPFLRRIHESPSPHKLRALNEFVRELGLPVSGLHDRFELQRLLNTVATLPEQYAVNYAVLRAMQRAVYSPKDEGHYALASDCYCHFTSPIRRYPDLHIHRLLDEMIRGRKPRSHHDDLVVLGQHCSDREQRADAAERDLTRLKLLAYLSDQIGLQMEALVTGVENFGLFVQGVELPAEGLIRTESLADDYYTFDRSTHSLTGRRFGNRYRLGDRLRVVVTRVDPLRRELDFRLLSRDEEEDALRFKARGGKPKKIEARKEPGKNNGKRRKKRR
jgi:ribonuclease R